MDKNESATPVADMTDRALLEELVTSLREARVAIAGAAESLSGNPMLKMLGGNAVNALLGGK